MKSSVQRRRKAALCCLLFAILTGCGGGSGGVTTESSSASPTTNEQLVRNLETTGVIPNLERSTTLTGTDANSNGIRDDVETFITNSYSGVSQQAAARQFASAMQLALLVDKSDLTAVKSVAAKSARSINCLYTKFDGISSGGKSPAQVVQELRGITTNTKARLLAYLAYTKALDGTSGTLPGGDTCE
jgi:hypothetical protein